MSWVCCLGPELLYQSQFVASFSLQSPHSSQAVLWLPLCPASSHLSAYYQESVMDAEAHWCGSPDHPRAIRLLPCSNFCRWLMLPSCFQFLISLQTTILWEVSQLLLTLALLSPNVPSIHPHHYPWSLHLKKCLQPQSSHLLDSLQIPLMASRPQDENSRAESHQTACNVQFQLNKSIIVFFWFSKAMQWYTNPFQAFFYAI